MPRKGVQYKFDDAKKKEYLRMISEEGQNRTGAAKAIGISRPTIGMARDTDPDFARAESEAEMEQVSKVENALYEAAVTNKNVTAIQVYLYNRCQDRWADKRNIAPKSFEDIEKAFDMSKLTVHEKIQFRNAFAKLAGDKSATAGDDRQTGTA